MLKAEGKINDVVIENMMNWPPARRACASESATAASTCIVVMPFGRTMKKVSRTWHVELVRLRKIIRASFSQQRMTYIAADQSADGVSKVIYQSKDGRSTKTFDALDWLAQLVAHIPNKGESGGGGPNLPKFSIPRQKNSVDNKTRFSYQEGYCLY